MEIVEENQKIVNVHNFLVPQNTLRTSVIIALNLDGIILL